MPIADADKAEVMNLVQERADVILKGHTDRVEQWVRLFLTIAGGITFLLLFSGLAYALFVLPAQAADMAIKASKADIESLEKSVSALEQQTSLAKTTLEPLLADVPALTTRFTEFRKELLASDETLKKVMKDASLAQINEALKLLEANKTIIADAKKIQDASYAEPPLGTVLPFFGNDAPVGWHLCDGSALPQDTDKNLSEKLQGRSPNLAGRVLRGKVGRETPGLAGGSSMIDISPFVTEKDGKHKHRLPDLSDQIAQSPNVFDLKRPYHLSDAALEKGDKLEL